MVNVAEFGENQNMDEGIQDQNIAEGGEDETIAEGGEDENVAETDENQNIPEVVVKEEPLDAHECDEILEYAQPAMEVEEDDPFLDDVAVNDSSDLVAKMEVDAADAEDSALTADNNDHLPHSLQMQDSVLTADNNDPLPHSMQMQVKEIKEENDDSLYGEQFEKYKETETADAFAVKLFSNKPIAKVPSSTEGKQRSNILTYDERGFQTCEFFAKGGVSNHMIVIDGHRLYMNSKRAGTCMYKCMYRNKGCSVRFKIHTNLILKVNEHDHSAVKEKEQNWHYRCVYCRMMFTDLEKRREHILGDNHSDLPYKIRESDCILAEWNASDVPYRDEFQEPDPIDKIELPPDAVNYPLPNAKHIKKRIFIDLQSFIYIANPSLTNIPEEYYPAPIQARQPSIRHPTQKARSSYTPSGNVHSTRAQNSKSKDNVSKSRDANGDTSGKENDGSTNTIRIRNRRNKKQNEISDHIDDVINSVEGKVVMYCDICDIRFKDIKQLTAHKASKSHDDKRQHILNEEEKEKAALTFDKPIFTEDFIAYNKKMEAELRTLRKAAVELEEQNAVLTTHINEMNGVVDELNNAKQLMVTRHEALDQHLKDLKEQLSTVFGNVLAKEISNSNFNETFNKVSMAITGSSNRGMLNDLKQQLKTAHIDAVML